MSYMTLENLLKSEEKKDKSTLEKISREEWTPDKLEEEKLSFGRKLYHIATALPALALSYASAGIGGLLFTNFLTLGGIAKRKKSGKRFSGEKTFKDIKAGGLFSPMVQGLYSFVNTFENPIVKTLALNPVSYFIFNGSYLAYTYTRDKVGRKILKGYSSAKKYFRETYDFLKKEWMPLNRKMLGFLPINYANVNLIKEQWQQIGLGSLIDFAYGLITTRAAKRKNSYASRSRETRIPYTA